MEKYQPGVIIRKSTINGKGLFATSRLPGRKKIGELEGVVISIRKANALAKKIKRIAIVELNDKFALDATLDKKFRYINHSCGPNAYLRVINSRVQFYALRDIKPGEEITANYGLTHHEGTLPCKCGAANCKGYL